MEVSHVTCCVTRFFLGPATVRQGDLCYGKEALDKIVKWEGPMKLGDYQEVSVTYLYKIDGLADWAKPPSVQAAFPAVKRRIDGAGHQEQSLALTLTSVGWEARGLNQ